MDLIKKGIAKVDKVHMMVMDEVSVAQAYMPIRIIITYFLLHTVIIEHLNSYLGFDVSTTNITVQASFLVLL